MLRRGYHRQEQMGRALRVEVQRDLAAEVLGRRVGGIVVRERPTATPRVLHVRQRRRGAVVLVVAAADAERDAVALGNDDAGRPDLDVELDNLTGLERLLLVV